MSLMKAISGWRILLPLNVTFIFFRFGEKRTLFFSTRFKNPVCLEEAMASEEDLQNMSPEEVARVQKESCIFCKIIKGEIQSRKVYEDDRMLAILDINPAAKGHTVILPKEHYPILPVIPPDVSRHMFRTAKYIAAAMKKGLVVDEVTVFVANGAIAGQQSPHFLFHLIPNDGFAVEMPKGKASAEEMQKVTPALRANVAAVMRNYLMKECKLAAEAPRPPPVRPQEQMPESVRAPEPQPSPEKADDETPAYSRDNLAKVIMENHRLRELIINSPEKIKELMKTNQEIAALFEGVNIDRLSEKLRKFEKKDEGKDEKGAPGGNDEEKKPEGDDAPTGPGNPEIDKIARLFT
jgi:histidine triad (HIT) family protein